MAQSERNSHSKTDLLLLVLDVEVILLIWVLNGIMIFTAYSDDEI